MIEENIYRCDCGCGCKREVDDPGDICGECLKSCSSKSTDEECGYCVYCGQEFDEQQAHCGEKCLEKCRRHDCLWICDKCGECCCGCECKNID